ncbi:MAG TPA: hypothetical protein VGH04_14530 [Gemmatimonadaceae bacterium]
MLAVLIGEHIVGISIIESRLGAKVGITTSASKATGALVRGGHRAMDRGNREVETPARVRRRCNESFPS